MIYLAFFYFLYEFKKSILTTFLLNFSTIIFIISFILKLC